MCYIIVLQNAYISLTEPVCSCQAAEAELLKLHVFHGIGKLIFLLNVFQLIVFTFV